MKAHIQKMYSLFGHHFDRKSKAVNKIIQFTTKQFR